MPTLFGLGFDQWAQQWDRSAAMAGACAILFAIVGLGALITGFVIRRLRPAVVEAAIVNAEPVGPVPGYYPGVAPAAPSDGISRLSWLLLGIGGAAVLACALSAGCTGLAYRNGANARANAAWSARIVEDCQPVVEQSEGPFTDPPPALRGKLFIWDQAATQPTPSEHTEDPSWLLLTLSGIPRAVRAQPGDAELTACFIVAAEFEEAGEYEFPGGHGTQTAYHADLHIVAVRWPSLEPAGCFSVRSQADEEIRKGRETSGRFHFRLGERILAAMSQP